MDATRLRSQSVDDEDCYGYRQCCHSSLNSDSEYSGSVSVRDMIRHYDSQAESGSGTSATRFKPFPRKPHSHHVLCDGKLSQCDDVRIWENRNRDKPLDNDANDGCCKSCTACRCCQNRSRKNSNANKSVSNATASESLANLNTKDVAVHGKQKKNVKEEVAGNGGGWLEFKDDSTIVSSSQLHIPNTRETNRLPTVDVNEEGNCHTIETSYQSKTTIAKTASGVRIIIDIFFDQEHRQQCVNACDVLGSRVETNIPQSRILNEFQQQTRAVSVTSLE